MRQLLKITTAVLFSTLTFNAALADTKGSIKAFYDFLSNPGSKTHAQNFRTHVTDDWQSIGDYSGKTKSAEGLMKQMGFMAKVVPDLEWEIMEIIESGERVIVRGKATGTPNGPFFGVDGKGKSFTIMSIDVHTMKDGKIATSYHVEDWTGALRQLKTK